MESIIFSLDGRDTEKLFKSLKRIGGVTIGDASIMQFSDNESNVLFNNSVRGKRVYLLSSPNNSDKIIQLGLAMDAAKRGYAKEIIPILPYYPYARQDKKDQIRGAIGAKFIADTLTCAGATGIITCDLHAEQIQGFFNIPVTHIEGKYLFDKYVAKLYKNDKTLVLCAPDAGSSKRVKQLRDRVTELIGVKLPIVQIDKSREEANQIASMDLIGNVKDMSVLIYDDMIDTFGTANKAIDLLFESGANNVYMVATHGVLSGPAMERLNNSKITKLIISDSLKINDTEYSVSDKIEVISLAELLSMAISSINNSDSFTDKIK